MYEQDCFAWRELGRYLVLAGERCLVLSIGVEVGGWRNVEFCVDGCDFVEVQA